MPSQFTRKVFSPPVSVPDPDPNLFVPIPDPDPFHQEAKKIKLLLSDVNVPTESNKQNK